MSSTTPYIIKKGPFGSHGGFVKDMNPTDITRIVKITIHHSKVIDALIVYFERNGTTECTDRWGGDGGTVTEVDLKTNEYITSVKGYNGHQVVMSLVLETNLGIYGPYGTKKGEFFELNAIEGQIIGFHARYGRYVNAIGVYVQPTGPIIKKEPFGGDGGIAKDMDPTDITRIVKITIYHGDVIDSLIVYFQRSGTTQCTDRWGGDGGGASEINLKTDEYITHVEGYYDDNYYGHKVVASLTLKTNLAVYGPYGKQKGKYFEHPALGGKIIGFYAYYGKYVNAVGVYDQATGPIIKKGPYGGDGEKEKDMDPMGITHIAKIIIHHDEVIDSITVHFEHNGTTQFTDRWGGDGGDMTEINLETNEYITNVKGYINDDYYGQKVVMSLVLETNFAVYGPYGTEKGKSFELPAYHGKIMGFHARHGIYVNAVGVYVQATSPIMKKGPFGAPRGTLKDMDPMGITRIVQITINHSDVIDALTVYFERNGTPQCTNRWGGDGGTMAEIIFKTNEYVTFVKGYIKEDHNGYKVVMALMLETNLAFYGPFGTEEGEYFEFPAINGKIIGFHARYEKYVNAVGVYVQSITPIIKKGPIGLSVKAMDPANITRIVKITICHSEVIDALRVYFEHNGTTECTDRWGGDGGTVTEIDLKENEYITYVKGYYNDDYNGHEVVMSLVMKTNLAIYGPYGKENGQSFELSALHGQIIGFHALHGKYVNAVGVYVQASGPIMKKGPAGSSGELVKDMDPTHITRIVKISVHHSYVIDALTVYFERNGTMECTNQWGGHGGNVTEINLKPYEYIKSVKGYIDNFYDDPTVSSLLLETNFANIYGPFGTEKGESFELSAPHSQIIGFHARHGKYINAIGCYVQAIGPIIKKGPIGGSGGDVKDMDPTDITRIVKICIYHDNNLIQGLNVYFERYGITESINNWGRTEGNLTEINLETNEYIMSVRGSRGDHNNHWVVKSLVLETNLKTYGPYGWEEGKSLYSREKGKSLYSREEGKSAYSREEGKSAYSREEGKSAYSWEEGKSFEHSALYGEIIGFHAQAGWHLDAIGVYIKPTKGPIIKKGRIGGSGGGVKDMDPTDITRIVKICIYHDYYLIQGLNVYFERYGITESTNIWGRTKGKLTEINLETNEYIMSVRGYCGDYCNHWVVKSLVLETNLKTYGPYGWEDGKSFKLSSKRGQIIGFHAQARSHLDAIGVYIKPTKGPIIKKGPIGSSGESVKSMDPTRITRIVKIIVHHSDVINALTVYFERNGTTKCTDQWGVNGGNVTEVDLKTDEYITSVKGYIDNFNNSPTVSSLVLETNLGVYGPYGTEKGKSFELGAIEGQIIGFHARFGTYVNTIGVYVKPLKRKLVLCGGSGGLPKDMDLTGLTRIVSVSIRHSNSVINALSVSFDRNGTIESTSNWGGNTGALTVINLKPEEYIKSVRGYVGYFGDLFIVRSLELITNLKDYGPFGKQEGTPFELSALGGHIVGFHGRSGAYLDAIGVYALLPANRRI